MARNPPIGLRLGRLSEPPLGFAHERAPGDGDGDRVWHLGARPAGCQRHGHLVPGGERLPGGDLGKDAAGPVGLRGGEPAPRRPRLRPHAGGGRLQPAHRRGSRARQRHPHQRRPALRRPRPPRVLHARMHKPAGRGDLGQGGGAGDGRGGGQGRHRAGRGAYSAVQEQHRQFTPPRTRSPSPAPAANSSRRATTAFAFPTSPRSSILSATGPFASV